MNRRKARGSSGEQVSQGGGVPRPCADTTKLAMTVTVKATDTRRWICRMQLYQFKGASFRDEPEADRAHHPIHKIEPPSGESGALTPNCFAYSALSRCPPPSFCCCRASPIGALKSRLTYLDIVVISFTYRTLPAASVVDGIQDGSRQGNQDRA